MVQLFLLIVGVFAIVRMPRLLKVGATDYPGVDAEAFRLWRSAEMSSAIWLIVATWGLLIVQVGVLAIVVVALAAFHRSKETIHSAVMMIAFGGAPVFLLLLVPAAIYGSKAKKLKQRANILWPKKG